MDTANKIAYRKLRIFVGCPGDVAAERGIVEKVATSLQPLARKERFEFEVVHWGHVPPDAGRAQDVIFKFFPPETWDVFIGILWSRFGTKPGATDPVTGKEYLGGTEEEFRKGYELWKSTGSPRIKIYNCTKDVPKKGTDFSQLEIVTKFLEELWNPNGDFKVLSVDFADEKQFEGAIQKDLQQLIIDYSGGGGHGGEEPQPPAHNLPARIEFFGREKDLETVRSAISSNSREWGILITAIGGTGKTALAVEAAYRAMDEGIFKACVFVTAKQSRLDTTGIVQSDADATAVDEFINETARAIGQPGIAQMDSKDKKKALLGVLRQLSMLLVYDNLETLAPDQQNAVEHFVGELPPGSKAILTSRREGAGTGRHLSLKELDWGAAEKIIAKEIGNDGGLAPKLNKHKDRWKELYDETYGSPLALMHLLGLLRVRRVLDFDGALQLLQTKVGIQERIDFMFSEARKELNEQDKAVMYALSFFVPSADLKALAEVAQLEANELGDAIDHLGKLCLLDTLQDTDRYTLHPLTREFAQKELQATPEIAYEAGLRFAGYWLAYAEQYGGDDNESYKTFPLLDSEWPNIDAATNWLWKTTNATGETVENEECATMLNSFARALSQFLFYAGRWDEQILLSERVYIAMKLIKDEYYAGWGAYDVSFILFNRGDIAGAENWCNKAVGAWKTVGSKREEATGLRMLGDIARIKSDYTETEKHYLDALTIYRELGEKNDTATGLNGLGMFYRIRMQYDKAEQFYKEAVEAGTDLGSKALYMFNLGNLEIVRENWQVAKVWYVQSLQLAKDIGRQQVIAASSYGLALVEEEQGQLTKALESAEIALKIHEKLQSSNLQLTRDLVARLKEKITEQG